MRMRSVLVAGVVVAAAASGGSTAAVAAKPASVYVIQGVQGATWTLSVDDEEVAADAPDKEIVGPLALMPGSHTVTATGPGGAEVSADLTVEAGASVDVVLHRPVDPTADPLFTSFVNDLSPVKAGSGRVTVAHTAVAPPADIRVNGEVLLADVASAEEITAVVPAGVYPIEVVPAATDGPAVLGPVDLPIDGGNLTRVFAIGVAWSDHGRSGAGAARAGRGRDGAQRRPRRCRRAGGGPLRGTRGTGCPVRPRAAGDRSGTRGPRATTSAAAAEPCGGAAGRSRSVWCWSRVESWSRPSTSWIGKPARRPWSGCRYFRPRRHPRCGLGSQPGGPAHRLAPAPGARCLRVPGTGGRGRGGQPRPRRAPSPGVLRAHGAQPGGGFVGAVGRPRPGRPGRDAAGRQPRAARGPTAPGVVDRRLGDRRAVRQRGPGRAPRLP